MKLTDHAKNLSLSHTASDDSRLGEAFLIAIEALDRIIEAGNNIDLDVDQANSIMHEKASDALVEIESI